MARGWGKRERQGPRIYRVGEVNDAARRFLESKFSDFWVEAEVSQVKRSRNGHVYFTLSDEHEKAQLDAVMFQKDASRCQVEIQEGARIRCRGQITLYTAAGRFQMVVRHVAAVGAGDLAARFEQIRKALEREGLLAPERKRTLPRLPRRVGIVTSAHSAALRDMIRVAHARAPVPIVVADCVVQGRPAPDSIVGALRAIVTVLDVDVVLLGRGGGAAEELWAFNSEKVARAVARCPVPVVCGVGHETDVTIAELVADVRASTPSNAAELAVPDREVLLQELRVHGRQLTRAMAERVRAGRRRIEWLERLPSLETRMTKERVRLAHATDAVQQAAGAQIRRKRATLEMWTGRVRDNNPRLQLARDRARLGALRARLDTAAQEALRKRRRRLGANVVRLDARPGVDNARHRLGSIAGKLRALSPLQVLERGYAIAFAEGQAIRRASEVAVGDEVAIRLHDGELTAVVTKTSPGRTEDDVEVGDGATEGPDS